MMGWVSLVFWTLDMAATLMVVASVAFAETIPFQVNELFAAHSGWLF